MASSCATQCLLIGALALFTPAWAWSAPMAGETAPAIDYASLPRFDEVHVITNPGGMIATPTAEELLRAYPKAARAHHLNGRATIRCRVTLEGRMTACEVASETPAGVGIGEAALSLAPRFLMHPATHDGVPVAGYAVRIPIVFNVFPGQPIPQAPPEVRRYAPVGSDIPAPPELNGVVPPHGRLSILGVAAKGPTVWFLSLDDVVRHGDIAEVTLMSVAKVPLSWRGALLVVREKIDCANMTSELEARRDFDDAGHTVGWTWIDYANAIPIVTNTEEGQAMLAVCKGAAAKAIVNGSDEAMKVARAYP